MRHSPREIRFEERAQDLVSTSRKLARRSASEARSFIHARPILSLFLGAGVGAVLALLFRPRT